MPLLNPFGNSYLDPFTRRQAQVIVDGDLTPQQHADVQRVYAKFKLQQNAAVTRYAIHNATLPDGTTVRIVSNYGNDQVFVTTSGGVEQKTFMGVWVLISLYSESSTAVSASGSVPDPNRRNTGQYRSLLYKIPKSMKVADAKLMYSGETLVDYTITNTLSPPDINGPASVYISDMRGSVTDTNGALGFVSTFVPYKGAVLYAAFRSTQVKTASSRYDGTSTTVRTCTVWDGDSTSKTYTANYELVSVGPATSPHSTTSTRSGEIICSPPRMVANGQLNYKVRELAGSYGNGNADPTRFEKFVAGEGANTDTNGIELAVQTGNPPSGFTRRQIGYMDQSPKCFLTKSPPFQVRTRDNVAKRVIPVAGSYDWPVFYDDGLYFRVTSNDNTQRKVSLMTNTARKVLTLDMRGLPGLSEDSLFAIIDPLISTGSSGSAGSNIYVDEIGYGDFHPDPVDPLNPYLSGGEAPRRFAWTMNGSTVNPTYGGLDTVKYTIQATLIPDQDIYKWEDEA